MIQEVHLRRPIQALTLSTLSQDSWPDVVSIPRINLKTEVQELDREYSRWTRHLDRLLLLSAVGENLKPLRDLFGFIRQQSLFRHAAELVNEGRPASQLFAQNLPLHSPVEPAQPEINKIDLQQAWKNREVTIAYDPKRLPNDLMTEIKAKISNSLPINCSFKQIDFKDLSQQRKLHSFDAYLTTVGVDSINLDGALSYYFELERSLIRSDHSPNGNFIARLKAARQIRPNIDLYRQIVVDAVAGNYVLPILHYSTLWIGRKNIDFSNGTVAKDTIHFQALRLRDSK